MSRLAPTDLPSADEFLEEAATRAGGGGALLTGLGSLGPTFSTSLRQRLENYEVGWSPRCVTIGTGGLTESMAKACNRAEESLGRIAIDASLANRVVIAVIPKNTENAAIVERDAGRFWLKRKGEQGPDLFLLYEDCPIQIPEAPASLCWNARGGFQRIDRMIWALTHIVLRDSPWSDLVENLAVEAGGQELGHVAAIAASGRDDILRPERLLEDLFPHFSKEKLDDIIWRAQVKSLMPWIEQLRRGFVARYGQYLLLDERQKELRVERVEDIEIGGVAFQLKRAGCLEPPERDLVTALQRIRVAVAHGKSCDPEDLETALAMSLRV